MLDENANVALATWVIEVEQRLAKIEAYLRDLAEVLAAEWPIEWPDVPAGRAGNRGVSGTMEAAKAERASAPPQKSASDAQA